MSKEKVMEENTIMYTDGDIADITSGLEFSVFCEKWFALNTAKWKISSAAKYQSMLRKHILPKFGHYPLEEITTDRISRFTNELLTYLSVKSVRDVLALLHQILSEDPFHSQPGVKPATISYPELISKELRILSRQEQSVLTQYLNRDMDRHKFVVLLALSTGMRVGEICGLRWKDFSENADLITVTHTVQRIKNITPSSSRSKTILQLGVPKTQSSVRSIPLSKDIQKLCQYQKNADIETFLVTGTTKPADPRVLQRALKKYTDECRLSGVHFHTLRHTFATRCVEVGYDIKTLSELLGHSNISMTMNRYVHPSLEFKRQNLQKLEEAGFGCSVK